MGAVGKKDKMKKKEEEKDEAKDEAPRARSEPEVLDGGGSPVDSGSDYEVLFPLVCCSCVPPSVLPLSIRACVEFDALVRPSVCRRITPTTGIPKITSCRKRTWSPEKRALLAPFLIRYPLHAPLC